MGPPGYAVLTDQSSQFDSCSTSLPLSSKPMRFPVFLPQAVAVGEVLAARLYDYVFPEVCFKWGSTCLVRGTARSFERRGTCVLLGWWGSQ